MIRTFTVAETIDSKTRKDGSLSFFKGKLLIDGNVIAFQASTKLTDDPANSISLNKSETELTLGGSHLDHLEACIPDPKSADEEDEALALPEIVAVSKKQRAYAEKMRSSKFSEFQKVLDWFVGKRPEDASIVEKVRAELATNNDAKFWIETPTGGIDPMYGLQAIVKYMSDNGRPLQR